MKRYKFAGANQGVSSGLDTCLALGTVARADNLHRVAARLHARQQQQGSLYKGRRGEVRHAKGHRPDEVPQKRGHWPLLDMGRRAFRQAAAEISVLADLEAEPRPTVATSATNPFFSLRPFAQTLCSDCVKCSPQAGSILNGADLTFSLEAINHSFIQKGARPARKAELSHKVCRSVPGGRS